MFQKSVSSLAVLLLLSGCAGFGGVDFSEIKTSGPHFDQYVVHVIDSTTTQPLRLTPRNMANAVVDVSKSPLTSHCSGFTNWYPNELVRVTTPMDLRFFMLGQMGDRNVTVLDPQGKFFCGEFSQGEGIAEITIKNAIPGTYQVRAGSRLINPNRNNMVTRENISNQLYLGDLHLFYAENVTDGEPFQFDNTKLAAVHAAAYEEARSNLNREIDAEYAKLEDKRRREKREFSMALSEFVAAAGQAVQQVAEERYSQERAIQDANEQIALDNRQQRTIAPSPITDPILRSAQASSAPRKINDQKKPDVVSNSKVENANVTSSPTKVPAKKNYPASILEFNNPNGWKRGDSSGEQMTGDLSIEIETRAVATKGKMSVVTSFCNNSDSVWKGGIRVSSTPPPVRMQAVKFRQVGAQHGKKPSMKVLLPFMFIQNVPSKKILYSTPYIKDVSILAFLVELPS